MTRIHKTRKRIGRETGQKKNVGKKTTVSKEPSVVSSSETEVKSEENKTQISASQENITNNKKTTGKKRKSSDHLDEKKKKKTKKTESLKIVNTEIKSAVEGVGKGDDPGLKLKRKRKKHKPRNTRVKRTDEKIPVVLKKPLSKRGWYLNRISTLLENNNTVTEQKTTSSYQKKPISKNTKTLPQDAKQKKHSSLTLVESVREISRKSTGHLPWLKQSNSLSKNKNEISETEVKVTDSESVLKKDDSKNVKKSLSFREQMLDRLTSARFRTLNEKLYTSTSAEAQEMFIKEPDSFKEYHEGYEKQVALWPINPVDKMIVYVNRRKKAIVADFGCGDAKLARNVTNKVHSFDLVALNNHVTPCDMAKVPLPNASVDIAVFCLSLMGTNIMDFITEARRIIKPGGVLKIAEVFSRFTRIKSFIRAMKSLGFEIKSKDFSNSHFVMFDFMKSPDCPERNPTFLPGLDLKPCLYKRR